MNESMNLKKDVLWLVKIIMMMIKCEKKLIN